MPPVNFQYEGDMIVSFHSHPSHTVELQKANNAINITKIHVNSNTSSLGFVCLVGGDDILMEAYRQVR